MAGLLSSHVLAHLSLGGDCRRVAVRSAIAGGRGTRVTTPWALDTISGRDFTESPSVYTLPLARLREELEERES